MTEPSKPRSSSVGRVAWVIADRLSRVLAAAIMVVAAGRAASASELTTWVEVVGNMVQQPLPRGLSVAPEHGLELPDSAATFPVRRPESDRALSVAPPCRCPASSLDDSIVVTCDGLAQAVARLEAVVARLERKAPPARSKAVIRHWLYDHGYCTGKPVSRATCATPAGCQVDHKIPLRCGGPDRAENLQLLCGEALREKNRNDVGADACRAYGAKSKQRGGGS